MAYDEELADRVRELVQDEPGLTEKKMFGGLGFMVGGNMAVAASGQGGLMVRSNPAQAAAVVDEEHVHRMEMRGRSMDGWLRVDLDGLLTDEQLERWVDHGVACARSLPPKG
jgi:TfoX/Sxy family transcriptional regulator of competence genes